MKIRESWVRATEQLTLEGIPDAGLEAEILHRHTMKSDRAVFFADLEQQMHPLQEHVVNHSIQRRITGEPLAYILGKREFYGLEFFVNSNVLVPRQETEILVDKVIEIAESSTGKHHIADVGTGSGAIAIAVACHIPSSTVHALDFNPEALRVAERNVEAHGIANRVHLLSGDLLNPLGKKVDVIVSNLPYLRTQDLKDLPAEVQREPASALDGGLDGLELIRRLLRQSPYHIRTGGCILLEISPEQLSPVTNLAKETFPMAYISFSRDLMGFPRMVDIRLPRE